MTHIGKSDPPRKFSGETDEAVSITLRGTDLTNYTFMRDAPKRLDMDIQIHNDPRWLHSTVSASCADVSVLETVQRAVAESMDLFLFIRGTSGLGKDQPWEVLHVGVQCPAELRDKFSTA